MSNYVKSDRAAEQATRERLEQKSNILKLAQGDNFIRILPPHQNMVDPETGAPTFYFPVPLHFNVGTGGPMPCPRRLGRGKCPVCNEAFRLINTGHEQAGKDLLPNYQMLMNVLVFDKGGEPVRNKAGDIEVQMWGPSRKVLDEIFEAVQEKETETKSVIDISDPEEGFLVRVKRTGSTQTDTRYSVKGLSNKPVSVMDFESYWDADLADLTQVHPYVPADQLERLLAGEDGAPTARPALAARASSLFEDETVEGEFTVPEEDDEPPFDTDDETPKTSASERLKAMVKGAK